MGMGRYCIVVGMGRYCIVGGVGHPVIMGMAAPPGLLSLATLQPLQPQTQYPTPDIGSHTARSPREILLPYGDVGVLSDLVFFMV